MTVKELIEKLNGLNPDMVLGIRDTWDVVQELRGEDIYLIERNQKVVIDVIGTLE